MDFYTGSMASSRGISCMSSSFWLGGARVGNVPGNISWYLHNMKHNKALLFSSTFTKCGVTPSGRFFSLYNISYINNMGLPDIFNYLLYIIWELLIVPSRNSYHTSIILVSRFFRYTSYVLSQWLRLSAQYTAFVVLLAGGTDSVHAFYQQLYIVRLTCNRGSLVTYRGKIRYISTFVEMLLSY